MSDSSGLFHPPSLEPRNSHWRDILIALAATAALFYLWIGDPGIEMPLFLSAGAVVVVVAFKHPAIPCTLFVIFSFLRIHEAFPVLTPWRIPGYLAQLSLIVMFWHLVLARTIKPFWTRELTLFATFFMITCMTFFTSTARDKTLAQITDTYSKIGIIVLVLAWSTRAASDFQLISRLLTVSGAAVAGVAIYNKINGIGLVEQTRVTIGRAEGSVLGDPNDLSLALLFPLGFAAALMTGRVNIFDRALGAIGTTTVLIGIICTQSRGGLLGVAALCAVFGSRFIKSKVVLIGIGVLVLVGLFAFAGISDRSSGGAGQGVDESSEGRLNAWQTATNMALHRPLTGVGLSTFVDNYFAFTSEWDGKPHAVHSTWFGILAETGFPGIITFVTLVIFTALTSWRSLKIVANPEVDPRLQTAAVALFAALAGFCVSGTFLTQGFTWPFYIIFSLTVALSRVLSEERDREAFVAKGMGYSAKRVSNVSG